MDGAPFVGWSSAKDGYLVATGFAGWGITNGTAAGMILADLANGAENRWTDVFDARRVNALAGGPTFVKENLGVAAHLVGGYMAHKPHSVDDLAPGDAAILKIGGRNVAAYKDALARELDDTRLAAARMILEMCRAIGHCCKAWLSGTEGFRTGSAGMSVI